jgi:hypothetical protein
MNIFSREITVESIAAIVLGLIIATIVVGLLIKMWPKKRGKPHFRKKWRALQARCKDKDQWATAIFEADDLLDEALICKKIKGKTMGERLVSAQNIFSDNDSVWSAHKLRGKLEDSPKTKLNKTDVKQSLLSFGQALKDLGVV